MQLRKYQEKLRLQAAKSLTDYRKICIQMATGGGKTVVFADITSRYIAKNSKSVLIIVHRKELLKQTRKTIYNMCGVEAFSIVAGVKYVPPSKIYVAMVESANNRILKIKNIGLVIIDECHIAVFNKMHEHFQEQYILGFTATPLSSKKKEPVNKYYEALICAVDIPELIEQGYLCQNITYNPKDIVDRNELAIKNGEFDEAAMAIQFSKPKYINNTVEAYEKYSKGKKTIIFNVNIAHNNEVCKAFNDSGYAARAIDSAMKSETRDDNLLWLKQTKDAILLNVGIATTGFDEPTLECVIVNKAVMAMTLWLQMTGRGGRIVDDKFIEENQSKYEYALSPKSIFIIIDMGGNGLTHGDWNQSRNWVDIFNNPPKSSDGSGVAPVKSCPNCEALIPAGSRVCGWCGYQVPDKEIPIEQRIEEFVIITKNIDPKKLIEENVQYKEYYSFFQIGNKLAAAAKSSIATITPEYVSFILQKYYELGKEWTALNRKKGGTSKWNDWHKEQAKIHLYFQLKRHYPEWQPEEETYIKYLPELTPFQLKQNIDIKVMYNGEINRTMKIAELLPFVQNNRKGFVFEI